MRKLIIALVFLSGTNILSIAQNLPSYVPSNGLVGWWPFNGNTNDHSGNVRNGVLTGGQYVANRTGTNNSAIQFNSTSSGFVDMNIGSVLTGQFSVMMWVKANRTASFISESNLCPGSVSVPMANSNQNWAMQPAHMGNNLGVGISVNQNGIIVAEHSNNLLVSRLSYSVNSSDFNQIILVYKSDSTFLYVNGIKVRARAIHCPSSTKNINSTIRFGGDAYSPNFAGIIDDIGIWNRPLNQAEILALYNSQSNITYTITATSGQNGNINPTGITTVNSGESKRFIFTATPGFKVDSVIVNGSKVDSTIGYTFSNVQSNKTIRVTFKKSVPIYIPTNGLIGWWPFNGNANDESGSGFNGTVNGASLTKDRNGNNNSAYSFTTNQSITINNSNSQNTYPITISLWYKCDSLNRGQNGNIFSKYQVASWNGYGLMLDNFSDGRYVNTLQPFYLRSQTNKLIGYYGEPPFQQDSVSTNEWYHIIFCADNTGGKLYVNGILKSTDSWTGTSGSSANNFIWKIGGLWNNWFHGKIDDIGIWNRVLSQTEINSLYKSCTDSIISQPTNITSYKGTNRSVSLTHSGSNVNYQWQTNPIGCGWQNIPNANQYVGVKTNTLSINNLSLSNHGQLIRVITTKDGCNDTSSVVKVTISNVASDSAELVALKSDTTSKGIRIRQLETDLANKHDTLYVGSNITSDTLKISIRTGLSLISQSVNTLKVYPNPAATVLNIELQKPGSYIARLTGVAGETIVTQTTGSIDISGLSDGVYILSIYDMNNKLISTNKVLIVK